MMQDATSTQLPWSSTKSVSTVTSINRHPKPGKAKVYGAIIRSPSNRYVLVQGRQTEKWSYPKGHPNRFETPFECVGREVAEEIGIDSLPVPKRGIPLRVGYYYLFDVEEEFPLKPRDTAEVMNAGWFTVEEMLRMRLNVDASLAITLLE
jgi:8-oxo-dGTP pyrophosphatase MutT (NUDIX family)